MLRTPATEDLSLAAVVEDGVVSQLVGSRRPALCAEAGPRDG